MPGRPGRAAAMRAAYARFAPLSYASVQEGLTRAMASAQVGRNGWPVMVALCHRVYADGTLGRASADEIAWRNRAKALPTVRGA